MSSPGVLRELPVTENNIFSTKCPDYYAKPQNLDIEICKNCESSLTEAVVKRALRRRKSQKKDTQLTAKKLDAKAKNYINATKINVAVVENSSILKMMAMTSFALGNDLEACCHLIASHAACLRHQIMYRTLKLTVRHEIISEPMVNNLNIKDLDIDRICGDVNSETLVNTLKELPTEWYTIQITAEHEHLKDIRQREQMEMASYSLKPMHGLYVMVLPMGKDASDPICVAIPKPNSESNYDIRMEVESILNSNKTDLSHEYTCNDLYWKMRKKQDEKMNTAISELESSWLREWRVLFLPDHLECLDLIEDIHDMINKLITDSLIKELSYKNRWLLKKIACEAHYLEDFEIERAIKRILPMQKKLAKNIILSIIAKTKVMDSLKTARRKTLVLILDDCLDHISFESMKILKHQPITRFPSLQVAYSLFKQHESTMSGGYKIIKKSENLGSFIVNPSTDLFKMEKRMKAFIKYWLPNWTGLYGKKPDLEHFKNALKLYNILLYTGHGSGIQFLAGEEIERMRVMALVLLFGCNSIKLIPAGGRMPVYGVSNQYLMACSPCILGMLWEVTDGDIDLMTGKLMSQWAASKDKRDWSNVVEHEWGNGRLEFFGPVKKVRNQPNMLRAVANAKTVCRQYMTSAAIVVRGLPVKLVD